MTYKMVDSLEKLCGRVAGAAIEHRALISEELAERFKHKMPEGQAFPDIFQIQTWIAEELHEEHAAVTTSEKDVKSELTIDRQDREERGRFASDLRERLIAARGIFDAVYGPTGAEVMFQELPGFRVRVDPVPLYRQGLTVHDNILNPGFRRPKRRLDLKIDLEELARGMEPALDGLKRTLEVLRTGTQASNASLEAKDTTMGRLDRRTGLGARLLEALYAWAEHEGLARRVRLSSHVQSGSASEPDEGEAFPDEEVDSDSGEAGLAPTDENAAPRGAILPPDDEEEEG